MRIEILHKSINPYSFKEIEYVSLALPTLVALCPSQIASQIP